MVIWLVALTEPPVPLRLTSRTSRFGSWRCAILITTPYGPFSPGKGVVIFALMRVASRISTELQPGMHVCRTEGLTIALKTCLLLALNLCVPLSFMKPSLARKYILAVVFTALGRQASYSTLFNKMHCSGNATFFQAKSHTITNCS